MTIWAFLSPREEESKILLTESIRNGKSRIGWSTEDCNNLLNIDNWIEEDWQTNSRQLFLLNVEPDDWIVHINLSEWGNCIAVRVMEEYDFDQGLNTNYGPDFRHCFEVDVTTLIEFERNDPNIVPTVNLRPRYRFHRIYEEDGFFETINNL